MSDHYCCKKCGQRYDNCQCAASSGNSAAKTKVKSPPRKKRQRVPLLHYSHFLNIRFEVHPVVHSDPSKEQEYFIRMVNKNGRVLNHSESYRGGMSKALRRVQGIVNTFHSYNVLVVAFYASGAVKNMEFNPDIKPISL